MEPGPGPESMCSRETDKPTDTEPSESRREPEEPERETHIQTEGATGSQREPERARERF